MSHVIDTRVTLPEEDAPTFELTYRVTLGAVLGVMEERDRRRAWWWGMGAVALFASMFIWPHNYPVPAAVPAVVVCAYASLGYAWSSRRSRVSAHRTMQHPSIQPVAPIKPGIP